MYEEDSDYEYEEDSEGMYDYADEDDDSFDLSFDDYVRALDLDNDEINYNSDQFFEDSEKEEDGEKVEYEDEEDEPQSSRHNQYTQEKWNEENQTTKVSDEKFEFWSLLPAELKEMVLDELDFGTWLNLMCCAETKRKSHIFLNTPFETPRFSFHSIVKKEESGEKERIRIRFGGRPGKLMVKFKEFDGFCKFSWNLNNKSRGSVDIPECGYLKAAETFMKTFLTRPAQIFKISVVNTKTDTSVPSVSSKWPYLHSFLKEHFRMGKGERKAVDNQTIVDFINSDMVAVNGLVQERGRLDGLINRMSDMLAVNGLGQERGRSDGLHHKFDKCILSLPFFDGEKVKELIEEQLPGKMTDRILHCRPEFCEYDVKNVHGYKIALCTNQDTIEIHGPDVDHGMDSDEEEGEEDDMEW